MSWYIFYFGLKDTTKVPILRLSSAPVKICQILHVIFETTSQFFFKFRITLKFHQKELLCTFLAQTLYTLVKSSPLKCKFFRFSSAWVNFELTVNCSAHFASFFIVMTHNSPVKFKLQYFLLLVKGPHQSPNLETFKCSGEICQILYVIFESAYQFSFKFCINI